MRDDRGMTSCLGISGRPLYILCLVWISNGGYLSRTVRYDPTVHRLLEAHNANTDFLIMRREQIDLQCQDVTCVLKHKPSPNQQINAGSSSGITTTETMINKFNKKIARELQTRFSLVRT
jgi:hypothetical protein